MKKLGIFIALCLLFAGCKSTTQTLDDFVDETELNYRSYSEQDWEKSVARYEALTAKLSKEEDSLTEEERQMAMRAIGRYHALLIKKGINDGAQYLKALTSSFPEYLKGFSEGLSENAQEWKNSIKESLDTSALNDAADKFEETMKDLFN